MRNDLRQHDSNYLRAYVGSALAGAAPACYNCKRFYLPPLYPNESYRENDRFHQI